jgi:D-arabinose 1-dehydrogenase-like Zn-dependent alcohol dehydrogenase
VTSLTRNQVRDKFASDACNLRVRYGHPRGEGRTACPATNHPSHEPVGEIDAISPGVRSVKPGDRVGVSWFQAGCGRCAHCRKKKIKFCAEPKTWISNGGGYADYMIAEADGCTLLPDNLSWESAAPLFCSGFSAMSAYRAAKPQGGDRIGVIGFGGLGHLALQIAKAMGHEVVAITNSPSKVDDARKMGADEVLVVKDHVGQELQSIGGVDVILSFSPSMKQNSQSIQGLRAGGRFVTTAVSGSRFKPTLYPCCSNKPRSSDPLRTILEISSTSFILSSKGK